MRTDLPDELRHTLSSVAQTPRLLVASDFDGTIAPIVAHPPDARPIPRAIEALVSLAELRATSTALISGRSLADLRELSGVPDAVKLVGSHGSEFDDGFSALVDDDARARLEMIEQALQHLMARYRGATLETKPISVAFHVRNVAPDRARQALDEALAAALAATAGQGVYVTEGKAVREFAVIRADKGEALDLLRMGAEATAVVFFGDDVTDEKAFVRLRHPDVSVKVGAGDTAAQYRLQTPGDVATALEFLNRARTAACMF